MPLLLLPASLEDLESITRLQFASFLPSVPVVRLIHPHGLTDSILSSACVANRSSFLESHVKYIKVVDATNKSNILAFARWYVWTTDQPPQTPFRFQPFQPDPSIAEGDMNNDAAASFYEGIDELRMRTIGNKRCIYLSHLATHPAHQGLGCGRMLVQWGLDLASQLSLDCYLVATPGALSWYEKLGFAKLDSFSFDLGGDGRGGTLGQYTSTMMRKV